MAGCVQTRTGSRQSQHDLARISPKEPPPCSPPLRMSTAGPISKRGVSRNHRTSAPSPLPHAGAAAALTASRQDVSSGTVEIANSLQRPVEEVRPERPEHPKRKGQDLARWEFAASREQQCKANVIASNEEDEEARRRTQATPTTCCQ